MSAKKALFWVAFWGFLSLGCNAVIYFVSGPQKALQYLTGYFIEQSLSIDNLFLFVTLFSSFRIPAHYQRRVLNYGIAGAMLLRLLFILMGINLISRFSKLLTLFGITLVVSGIRILARHENGNPKSNPVFMRFLNKFIPVTHDLYGERFFVRQKGRLHLTPLFAVLILIELTDILFAFDSIPAIFSITTDPVIIYISNIFAILGLRSLYFLLGNLKERFQYVQYGIAFLLLFTGIKLILVQFGIEMPLGMALLFIVCTMIISIGASLIAENKTTAEIRQKTTKKEL